MVARRICVTAVLGTIEFDVALAGGWTSTDSAELLSLELDDATFDLGAGNVLVLLGGGYLARYAVERARGLTEGRGLHNASAVRNANNGAGSKEAVPGKTAPRSTECGNQS